MFVFNFNVTLAASGALEAGEKYPYICTLVCGESLRQFYLLYSDVESSETLNIDYIIRCLSQYFFPVNFLSKQKHAMRHGMKKPCSLTVRCYAVRFIDLNEYLASFPGANLTDNIGVTELDEIHLNSIFKSLSPVTVPR